MSSALDGILGLLIKEAPLIICNTLTVTFTSQLSVVLEAGKGYTES